MDQALQEIDRYLLGENEGKNNVLSLSSLRLSSLPDALLSWPRGTLLNRLNLDSNNLEELPSGFGETLECLVELSLSENCLASLPDSVGSLQSLKVFCVERNVLTNVPSCIFRLSGLELLRLSGNGLVNISGQWNELKNLKILHASENTLEELPDSLCRLENLQILDVSRNCLSTLPDEVGDLLSLQVLSVHRCLLYALPDSFADFENLQTLDISCNMLSSVPSTLKCASKLQQVRLNDNCLTSLPAWLDDLTVMEELDLSNNRLDGALLSEKFSQLCKSLRTLNAGVNSFDSLPDSVGFLEGLEVFRLGGSVRTYGGACSTGNCVTQLPDSFCELKQLREFVACENLLTCLPREIGQLQSLSVLDLRQNYLIELPESFCELETLTTLHLSCNLLRSLPSSFEQLKKLTFLHLEFNCLTELPSSLVNLTSLQRLGIAGNKLISFPIFLNSLDQLESVSFAGNPSVQFLPRDIAEMLWAEEESYKTHSFPTEWHSQWVDAQEKLMDDVVSRSVQTPTVLGIHSSLRAALLSGSLGRFDACPEYVAEASGEDWDAEITKCSSPTHEKLLPVRNFACAPSHAGSYTWQWRSSSNNGTCDDSEWEPLPDFWTDSCLPLGKKKEVQKTPKLCGTLDEWKRMFA